ncbi:hypothetical protein KI387_038194, partial [Taxus chinensis]
MKGDPGFKLFGKTIPMRDEEVKCSILEENNDIETPAQASDKVICQDSTLKSEVEGLPDINPEEGESFTAANDCREAGYKKPMQDSEKKIPVTTMESDNLKNGDNEEEAVGANGNEEKMPKKPDKLLPCPRCDSLDTKFCYYNNYNVNQPRHFCKNCQRYWTAGGTMRNVPVGAGRRKNKHSASHYRHMLMADGLAAARADCSDSAHHQVMSTALSSARVLKASQLQLLPLDIESAGGTVLNFGPDTPLCESMATALNLADQPMTNRQAYINKDDEKSQVMRKENRDDNSCGSSITASTIAEKEDGTKNFQTVPHMDHGGIMGWPGGIPPQHPYYGGPWPYGWNFGWGGRATTTAGGCPNGIAYASDNGNANSGAVGSRPPVMWAPGIPWPFVPGTYWASHPGWGGGAWNIPYTALASPATGGLSSPSSSSGGSCGSPTLGKHSRDIPHADCKRDGSLWVPKTLRIDDP